MGKMRGGWAVERGAGRQKRWRKIKFPAAGSQSDRATVPHLKHALWNKRRAPRRKNRILFSKGVFGRRKKREKSEGGISARIMRVDAVFPELGFHKMRNQRSSAELQQQSEVCVCLLSFYELS